MQRSPKPPGLAPTEGSTPSTPANISATERLREMVEAGKVNEMLTTEQLELLRQTEQEIDDQLAQANLEHDV